MLWYHRRGGWTVIAATLRQFELDGDVPRLFLLGGSADLAWIRAFRHRACLQVTQSFHGIPSTS
jgi:hypothetical protein